MSINPKIKIGTTNELIPINTITAVSEPYVHDGDWHLDITLTEGSRQPRFESEEVAYGYYRQLTGGTEILIIDDF